MAADIDFYAIEELLTPEERAARDRVRALVEAEIRPLIRDHHRDGTFPRAIMPLLGEAGCFGPYMEGIGRTPLSHTAYGLIMQELERADSGVRSCASVQGALAMHAIHSFGTEGQQERWLPPLMRGEQIGCFALTERGHGSDPGGMETVAREDGESYVLNGGKFWITNGTLADVIVVWAKDGDGRVGGFLVERGTPGLHVQSVEGKFSLRMSASAQCRFEECRIPRENRLPGARGLKAPLSCLSQARLGIAWGVLGAAMDCLACARDYTKGREQFGRPLAGFQLVQEKLVGALTELTKAQLLALRLTRLREAGRATPAQISMAKRNNVAMALDTARACRALLGGIGITDEYPVIRHLLNLETVYTYEGTHDIHTLVIGQEFTGESAFS